MEIIPSVLAKNKEELVEIKKKLEWHSGPLHIDIGDGVFVPTITVGREEIEKAFPSIPLHVHFMVAHPEEVIPAWLDLPNLASAIFHIEATDKALEIIDTVHQAGKQVTVAINPETDIALLESLVGKVDFIHFMTVHPGNYGAEFQESVVPKIADFHAKHSGILISVDGAITPEIEKMLENAGARVGIVGSDIVKNTNPEKEYERF